jgi:inhibitor of KinA
MHISPLGDSALLVRLGDGIDEATHRKVMAACARLEEARVPAMREYVPAFATVAVFYDPAALGGEGAFERVATAVREALAELPEEPRAAGRVVEIPVAYGGEMGPDLEEVARLSGLDPKEVVSIHAGGDYRVYMVGFSPGFGYLGGLDERIAVARRATPRPRVPASSVGIGGRQTGVYPIASPGGWQLIGRTPLRLFTPEADPPPLLRVGDRVRFRTVSPGEFRELEAGTR